MFQPSQKTIITLIIIELLLLAFLVCFFYGYMMLIEGLRGSKSPDDGSQAQRIVPDTFEAEKNIQDWTAYRNEEFGFEVKLPPGCIFKGNITYKESDGSFDTSAFHLDPKCYGVQGNLNGGVDIVIFNDLKVFESMAICRNGIVEVTQEHPLSEVLLCYQNLKYGMTTYDYAFTKKGIGYRFSTMHDDKSYNIKIEKAILNSFRFIDKE